MTTNKGTREAIEKMGREGEKPCNVYKHMIRLGVGEDTLVAIHLLLLINRLGRNLFPFVPVLMTEYAILSYRPTVRFSEL